MTALDDLRAAFTRDLNKSGPVESYRGNDWWQLSEAEEEVFGIELEDVPALASAWSIYEGIADIAHNEFHDTDLSRTVQAAYPWIVAPLWVDQRVNELETWQRFARMLGIPSRRGFQWYFKRHFDDEHVNIYSDEDRMLVPRPSIRVVSERVPEPEHDLNDGIPF